VIPQTSPLAAYLDHRADIDGAVQRVLASGWYLQGVELKAFEAEFARFLGVRHAIGVASGTDAIELALRAAGVKPGDKVATVSHTAVATVTAIEAAGAVPVLIDIDARSFTMDPERLDEAMRAEPSGFRAVVVVHLYGRAANMDAVGRLCRQNGALLVEDCAQAHAATIGGQRVGTFGDAAAFSFYPTKNLGALGDGGAVVTNDDAVAAAVRTLREYGWTQRYRSDIPGKNSRLDEIQAAVLRVKLAHLDDDTARRRRVAAFYDGALAGCDGLSLPEPDPSHVYHQYVVRTPERDELLRHLGAEHIGTLVHYPYAVHSPRST
jgi:dTDP-4-amino-4,6-dideoxygalactose transaminase